MPDAFREKAGLGSDETDSPLRIGIGGISAQSQLAPGSGATNEHRAGILMWLWPGGERRATSSPSTVKPSARSCEWERHILHGALEAASQEAMSLAVINGSVLGCFGAFTTLQPLIQAT
jgi:hypothetical protein